MKREMPSGKKRQRWEDSLRAKIHHWIARTPLVGPCLIALQARLLRPSAARYWEQRYAAGGDSGSGSYDRHADYKAQVVNGIVESYHVRTVIEFGCGDGSQLELAKYPKYVGVDVAATAVALCRRRFPQDPSKEFEQLTPDYVPPKCQLSLSLDVIYHLLEDKVFDDYMRLLFASSTRLVVIYSSNVEQLYAAPHVRHRCFTQWVERNASDFRLVRKIDNPNRDGIDGSPSDLYLYERVSPFTGSAREYQDE